MTRNTKPGGASGLMYYTSIWERSKRPALAPADLSAGSLLVFGGTSGLLQSLRDQFAAVSGGRGRLTVVTPGDQFAERPDGGYVMNPHDPADYIKCLNALREKGLWPDRLLHLWGTEDGNEAPHTVSAAAFAAESAFAEQEWVDRQIWRGIYSAFYFIKALAEIGAKSSVRFILGYTTEGSVPNPFFAALAGYVKSLRPALPRVDVAAVHLGFVRDGEEQIARAALAELTAERNNQGEVLYQGGERFVRKDRPIQLDGAQRLSFKQGATYLITGGAGGLGALFARHLAERYQANVALVGRSALNPAREELLAELHRAGGKALYLQADVGNLQEMTHAMQTVREQFGPLHGVIHAAGLAGVTSVTQIDLAGFEAVLKPKIHGTLVLDAITRAEPLDFFVLFSSLSSFMGDFGTCAYAIANRFLDNYAALREQLREHGSRQGRTVSVNWPLWREGGMHMGESKANDLIFLRSSGMTYLEVDDGLATFADLVGSAYSQVMLITGERAKVERLLDVAAESEPARKTVRKPEPERKPEPKPESRPGAANGKQPPTGPIETLLEKDLQQMAASVIMLNPSDLDIRAQFGEYGFDSNGIKALARQLGAKYGVEILPQVFFSHSTVYSLSRYMLNEHKEQVNRYYQGAATTAPALAQAPAAAGQRRKLEPLAAKFAGNRHAAAAKLQGAREPVAVIGISGIFPSAPDIDSFWEALESMRNLIREVPADRWDWQEHYGAAADPAKRANSKWGGFIDDVDKFDAPFFNISRREAELMDPQQRLFLQTAWSCIEDAGYKVSQFSGRRVAVCVGAQFTDYQQLLHERIGVSHPQIATGNAHTVLPNRVSYLFNLRGPSEAIDTACSSSLVAVNRAVQSIQSGESEMAIAGGVSLQLLPEIFLAVSILGVMAPDGKCKTFDASANGYARGEGIGAVLLKPLSKAVADGDHIYAVIRASAEGHGGKASSLTAPNAEAQVALLVRAYEQAGVDPTTVTYIEAHGTGTELGDPIEVAGLTGAFKELYQRAGKPWPPAERHCALGSTKTNIGHLEPAAGIAGLIKLLLAIKHKRLPGTLHLQQVNPYIDLQETPFYIVQQTTDWARLRSKDGSEIPLRAGISSFGFGGSYAHLVLEEYPNAVPEREESASGETHLFVLSAKNRDRLMAYAAKLADYMERQQDDPAFDLAAVAYTLQVGREELEERLAVLASAPEELIDLLREFARAKDLGDQGITGSVKKGKGAAGLLVEGPEGEQFVRALLRDGKLEKLAQLWVAGISIDWSMLYQGGAPHRMALPTYPFAKESYWVPDDMPHAGISISSRPAQTIPPRPAAIEPAAPAVTRSEVPVAERVQEEIRRIAAEVVKLDPAHLDLDGNFGDYGFDSISSREFAGKLTETLGVEIFPTVIFALGTVRELAASVLSDYGEALAAKYASAAAEQPIPPVEPAEPTRHPGEKLLHKEPVAVIGLDCRLPQSRSPEEFWVHLEHGHDLITEVPPDRWDWRLYYGDHVTGKDKANSKWGGFIDDVDKFDAAFFQISPVEAELMDPQQRLFLQCVWKAIERSGYNPLDLWGRQVGVYLGLQFRDYEDLLQSLGETLPQLSTGVSHAIHSNRVSYLLNLRGPSESIDTACSSSLIAIHHAVRSIQEGECEMAIAGGVSLMLSVRPFLATAKLGALSPDGRCKTMDKSANGYVKGEGVGAVLLKPLSRAVADGDHIYAVIRGSAEGHGGKAQSLTAPNAEAQAKLLIRAYEDAGIDMDTVSYIELHGTGTELGDPVEFEGLKMAFKEGYRKAGREWPAQELHCGLGAAKSNIGHLEPAAGIAGIVKVILAMQHQKLPATVHLTELNPYIDMRGTPFYPVRGTQPWTRLQDREGNPIPRRAGVSSFGFGGAYAHIVLEEYHPALKGGEGEGSEPHLIVLSARTEERLQAYVRELEGFLAAGSELEESTLQADLRMLVADLLGVDGVQLDPAEPLREFGMEALTAVQLAEKVRERYRLDGGAPAVSDTDSINTYAESLLQALRQTPAAGGGATGPEYTLANIAYTLQLGREAMEHRLGFVARSKAEMLQKLRAYLAGERGTDLHGGVCETLPSWAQRRARRPGSDIDMGDSPDLNRLASLWVAGQEVPFSKLWQGRKGHRVPLPTYPFARDRHWVVAASPQPSGAAHGRQQQLHPLVDANVSTLREQRFVVGLTGREPLLRDHVVHGNKILPGVAVLEMARAAGELSAEAPVRQLKGITWLRPVMIQGAADPDAVEKVYVSFSLDRTSVSFGVHMVDQEQQRLLCSQGQIVTGNPLDPAPAIDIEGVLSALRHSATGDECYRAFEAAGLQYGPSYRAIKQLFFSETEAVSVLELPSHLLDQAERFVLHPSLFDGALQTVIGLLARSQRQGGAAYVPYTIGQVDIYQPLARECYAYVRSAPHGGTGEIQKFHVEIVDTSGNVLLSVRDYAIRALPQREAAGPSTGPLTLEELMKKLERGELTAADAEQLMEGLYGDK